MTIRTAPVISFDHHEPSFAHDLYEFYASVRETPSSGARCTRDSGRRGSTPAASVSTVRARRPVPALRSAA
jgi:hypothetical protein